VLLQDFDPQTVLRTIEEERISLTVLVPAMIYALLDRILSHVRACLLGVGQSPAI
jgi:fatty-acyl-CoA synthase